MSDFDSIGKLMQLPLVKIDATEKPKESEFIINAAAEVLLQSGGRNWVPVIVKETGDYQYQVVSNHFIYAVVKKAELERVWCIVIEPEDRSIEQAKILTREAVPKVNLSTASKETILAALQYLTEESGSSLSTLKGEKAVKAAEKIAAANREDWADLSPIVNLKCGITKAKLDLLTKVFFLTPPPPVAPPPPAPDIISIKRASRDEIFSRLNYLSTYKIGGFATIDPDKAADVIFSESKSKWKSLNPIAKLDCGIDTAKIKTLKTVFSL